MFILGMFVISDVIQSLSTVAVAIGALICVGFGPFLFLQRYPAEAGGGEGEAGKRDVDGQS